MTSALLKPLSRIWRRNATTVITAVSVSGFLACILGLNYMAFDHILEHVYGDNSYTATIVLGLSWFMSAEMLINWILLCTVKSNFTNTEHTKRTRLEHEQANPVFSSAGMEYEKMMKTNASSLPTENWSVITHYYNGKAEKTAYPYWSWKPCVVCACYKPPRCHHCPICRRCVLKRDHHCYFAMQCVGLRNQRFFIVFNFWAACLTGFALPQLYYYFFTSIWRYISVVEIFLPWTIISYLIGWSRLYTLALVFQLWALTLFILLSVSFVVEQWECINTGKTSHELDRSQTAVKTVHTTRAAKLACVFGKRYQYLNLLVPLHWLYEPTDDGMTWISIKME